MAQAGPVTPEGLRGGRGGAPQPSPRWPPPSTETLAAWVRDAHERTVRLVSDLSDEQLRVPLLEIINPLLWEIGHVAWFHERWVLRHTLGEAPLHAEADRFFDSSAVAHDVRWELHLPSREATFRYLREVRDRLVGVLEAPRFEARREAEAVRYFVQLGVFHEDMHGEAFLYTRQTLGYPPPPLWGEEGSSGGVPGSGAGEGGLLPGDVEIPGGELDLGATGGEPFVFDNEKWSHRVELGPFRLARAPVTQGELARFVEDGGYRRRELWTEEGWRWREAAEAHRPLYWRAAGTLWERRSFDRWVPLEPHRPAVHVNAHEAQAYCRWAGRRLPTEAEWEKAVGGAERRYPWGDGPADPSRANLDARTPGCLDVGDLAAGDSPWGCRQMVGNVWEWTETTFEPYPGFEIDPYEDYSRPWFGTRKVLRGGAWPTRGRLLRNTYRNYYTPDRRDVWAGFRTCAAG